MLLEILYEIAYKQIQPTGVDEPSRRADSVYPQLREYIFSIIDPDDCYKSFTAGPLLGYLA